MTSSFSLFTSVLIYFILQYLKYQSVDEECNTSGKKSNVCSKVIYLIGVVLFVHRFERQPWRQTAQPFRLVFDAFSVLLAFEFLYNFLWLRLEFFFLEVVPATLESMELYEDTPEWPFVVPLFVISLLFLVFAHNSDIYIDHYLQLDDASYYESDSDGVSFIMNPVTTTSAGGFGEPAGRDRRLHSPSFPPGPSPVTAVPTRGRGTHTLTAAPLRRSERLQNRSTPDMDY